MSGPFGSSQWMYASGGFYNGVATQSLRFNDADNAFLSKTFSASNQKTWTWSGWVKRSVLGTAFLYSQVTSGTDTSWLYFTSNDEINMQNYEGANQLDIKTNAVFRDPSAWYHVVAVLDTTQATASNRAKIYVNGELQTSLANTTYPSQNADLKIGSGDAPFLIGATPDSYGTGAGYKFDGYFAEVNFIDGTALDASYFGETKNGVWIPKEYTGSYGTNGFRLQFNQTGVGTASSSTIGADTSGNANHLSSTNIVASDCDMPDSPENNFATLNPLDSYNSPTFSEGNLKLVRSSSYGNSSGTIAVNSGKWYWEIRCPTVTTSGENESFGISKVTTDVIGNNYLGLNTNSWALMIDNAASDIYFNHNNSFTDSGINASNGDIFMLALDADTGKLWFGRNGTWFDSGNPSAGTNEKYTASTDDVYYLVVSMNGNEELILNFGQDSSFTGGTTAQGNTDDNGIGDFYYSPPSGFLALCTANLPEPTISPNADTQADDYFNTVLWSGNGTSQSITGVGFQPDWVWAKRRDASAFNHLTDSVRGAPKALYSDRTDAESNDSNNISSLDSDGFSVGSNNGVNNSSGTYVAWNWKAGGTAVSNTDGTITSSVSANTDAGFSIVSFTGTGANATVGHGLGVAPSMIIFKNRDNAYSWATYNVHIGAGNRLTLEETAVSTASSTSFNSTDPTSSVFSVGTNVATNKSGDNIIAYCFANIEGYSKFGSYTGNGNADGTFVYTGFRPAWVMQKRTDGVGDWHILDNKRNTFNEVENYLYANLSSAEYAGNGDDGLDYLSNGFKLSNTYTGLNASGGTYIYMAFADNPFKYANSR